MPSKKKSKKTSTVPDIDFSVLRTAIKAGGRMINQIINGVHYGSQEIQQLLFEESDFIVECRFCKNLFRSLPNFIAHKRIYCQEFYADSVQSRVVFPSISEEETIIVQPISPEQTDMSACHTESQSEKTTVDKIINGEFQSSSAEYNFYTNIAQRIESQKLNKTSSTMKLTKISSNPNAVMVSMEMEKSNLKTDKPVEQCKNLTDPEVTSAEKVDDTVVLYTPNKDAAEVKISEQIEPFLRKTARVVLKRRLEYDLKKASDNSKAVNVKASENFAGISSARKSERNTTMRPVESYKPSTLLMRSKADGLLKLCDLHNLECLTCRQKYASRKSLLCHLQAKHSAKRTQHPCIYCDKSFSYFWGLTRHLVSSHNKTRNQVDKMRKKLWQHVHSINVNSSEVMNTEGMNVDSQNSSKTSASRKEEKASTPKKSLHRSPSKDSKKQQMKTVVPQTSIIDQLQDRIRLLGNKESRSIDLNRCKGCGKAFWKHTNYKNHVQLCAKWKDEKKEMRGKTQPEHIQRRLEQLNKMKESDIPGKDFSDSEQQIQEDDCMKTNKLDRSKDKIDGSVECDKDEVGDVENRLADHKVLPRKPTAVCKRPKMSEAFGIDYTEASTQVEHDNCESSDLVHLKNIALGEPFSVEEVGNAVNEVDFADEKSEKRELTPVEDMLLVEEIWVNKQPGKPPEKVKSNRIYVVEPKMSKPQSQCQDSKKVNQLVDEVNLQCLECKMEFSSISNVRRHVVRHLGWKRYKCKMCKFMSYNKSECNTHLYRTHSDRTRGFKANTFIVDLTKEASRLRNMKKQQTLSGKQATEKFDPFEKSRIKYQYSSRFHKHSENKISEDRRKPGVREENIQLPDINRFNISTRNSTREFDTRPYQVLDRMSTLFTRKGYYPKAVVEGKRRDKKDSDSMKGSEPEDDVMSTISHASTRSTRSHMSDSKLHSNLKTRTIDSSESLGAAQQAKEQNLSNRNIFESFEHEPVSSLDFISNIETNQLVETSEVEILDDFVENLNVVAECEAEQEDLDKKSDDVKNCYSDPVHIDDVIKTVMSPNQVQGENISDICCTEKDINEKCQTKEGHYLVERPEFSTGHQSPKWSTRRYRNSSNQDSNESTTISVPLTLKTENDLPVESDSDALVGSNEEATLGKLIKPEHFVKKSLRIAAIKSAQESTTTQTDDKVQSPSKRISPKSMKCTGSKKASLPVGQRVPLLKKHGNSPSKQRKSLEMHPSAAWSGSIKSKVDWGKCVSVKRTACWRKGAPFASRVVTKEIHVSPKQPTHSSQD